MSLLVFGGLTLKLSDMIYRISYSRSEDITNLGMDGRKFGFRVTFVPMEHLGTPEEQRSTVVVLRSNSGNNHSDLEASGKYLGKVLFEFARRFLKDALERGETFSEFTIKAAMNSTGTHRGKCLFNPSRLPWPEGFIKEIEILKRIGFGAELQKK